MTARERELRRMLRDLSMRGLHAVRNHRNPIARADLRRECLYVQANLDAEAAAARAADLAPGDPRPAPPLPADAPETPLPAEPAKSWLPYKED